MLMAKKKVSATFDVGARLKNIQALYRSHRSKEAIAYMFVLYTMLCRAKFGENKLPQQSIREFGMAMCNKHGQDPQKVYPFVQNVEAIIYGGRQPSEDVFKQSIEAFGVVFQDITGRALPQLIQ
jgi:hypothetical protein